MLKNGYKSNILFLPNLSNFSNNNRRLQNIGSFILKIKPNLIGISLMSTEYNSARSLTKYLKSFIKSVPIIWGGIHPTISPENCLDYADYVCVGEGENVILDVADAISKNKEIRNVNNLCYLERAAVKRNSLYPRIENLNNLPICKHIPPNSFIMEDKNITELKEENFRKYDRFSGKIYSIITSRGCIFSCTYCCNNYISRLYNSNKVIKRSIPNIIEELEKTKINNSGIKYINFLDDCFLSCSEEYLAAFCKAYKDKIGIPFMIKAIPAHITKDRIRFLKDAGLAWIELGLQSGSDRVCKEVYKRSTLKADFLRSARIINDFGIAAYYDIILDDPFEKEEDNLKTIETLMETPKPFYTQFYSLVFYRGTELYEEAKIEYPEYIENYLTKDYLIPNKNIINNLIRFATFIDKKYMNKIVYLYKHYPKSVGFRILLLTTKLLTMFIFEPLTYFRVIKLSQRGSYLRTLMVLPIYLKQGINRYLNQLKCNLENNLN